MNNEETIIMQPQNNSEKAQQTTTNVESPKEEKKTNSGAKVGATVAAATIGGFAGGAGTAAAADLYNGADEEEIEAKVDDVQETPAAAVTSAKHETKAESEEIPVTVDENGEADYTGHAGADPVAENPQPTPVSNDSDEVQVLGVYENEDGQEAAVLTDGQEIAVVLDATGNGEADQLWVDGNHNEEVDEGEVYDVTDQHISMSQYEEAYLAQQQEMEQQEQMQQETFAINADDQQDYNNDAPDLSFA